MPLPSNSAPLSTLLPPLRGTVLEDGAEAETEAHATLWRFARDWGGLVHTRPRAVVRPADVDDVAAVLTFAAETGVPVAARGTGHSSFGQSQAEGGIVLDLSGLNRVHPSTGTTLTADAGASWHRVTESALARGLTPRVLPDFLGLSVGGTLSVGGLGGASHRHGAQTDIVTELEVVTGTGEVLTCSPQLEPELFDAVRAGLGQCGVITKAVVGLGRARRRVRDRAFYYRDLDTFLADSRAVAAEERFDHLQGRVLYDDSGTRWYRMDAGTYFSLPTEFDEEALRAGLSFEAELTEVTDCGYAEFCDRMADGVRVQRERGDWYRPHPWLTVFVPDDAVAEIVPAAVEAVGELGESGLILLYPLLPERSATPLLRLPTTRPGEPVWLLGLLDVAEPHDPLALARRVKRNIATYQRVLAAGGTGYPTSALPASAVDWRQHFGDAWPSFLRARQRYDPAGVLAPGAGVFSETRGQPDEPTDHGTE